MKKPTMIADTYRMKAADRKNSAIACDMIDDINGALMSVTSMGLPSFRPAYLFLCRVPFEIMYLCLSSKLKHQPQKPPSPHSLRQLLYECKQTIAGAVKIRQKFLRFAKPALFGAPESDIDFYVEVSIFRNYS
jgi:hypothetical protein